MLRPSPRPARLAAFTLSELMIVVVIIGVVAALAAPTIGNALANRRTNEKALDVVRLMRHARSATMGHGVAHMAAFGADGDLTLWRGTNDRCNRNDWPTIAAEACTLANERCTDQVTFTVVGGSTYSATPGGGMRALCFEPNGRMFWAADASAPAFTSTTPAAGGFQVTVARSVGGATVGVPKLIAIPFGGDARIIR